MEKRSNRRRLDRLSRHAIFQMKEIMISNKLKAICDPQGEGLRRGLRHW
jgi:hypothetical protein